MSKIAEHQPEAKGEAWNRFSPRNLQEDSTLLASWYQTSSLQSCERINFHCLKPFSFCDNLLWQPQETNTEAKERKKSKYICVAFVISVLFIMSGSLYFAGFELLAGVIFSAKYTFFSHPLMLLLAYISIHYRPPITYHICIHTHMYIISVLCI